MSTSRDDFGIAIRSALLQRGAKQKFSLFVLILLSIFIFGLDASGLKPIKIIRSIINDGVYRVSAISSSPMRFFSISKNFFSEHIFVYKENKVLKKELEQYRSKNLDNIYLQTENKKLQEIVEMEDKISFTTIAAKVMLDKNSPYLNSFVINKGTNTGIKLGMPVISKGELVGRIVETNYFSSRILLLNDLNSRIPVVLSPSGSQAILSGIGKKYPRLQYLPENYEINEKESLVFTSGKDGVLFPGIAVGKVELSDNEMAVKLHADPDQIIFVSVALDQAPDGGAR